MLTEAPTRTDKEFVQSLVRGIMVITSFSREHPAMTLSQVAAETGLTRATARRFLLTLADMGYVRTDGRLFKLTPKILELGYSFLSSFQLSDVADPFLEIVCEKVKETTGIAVLDSGSVVFVGPVHRKHVMSFSASVGSKLPSYCTALGRVLLAGQPIEVLDDYLAKLEPTAYNQNTIVDKMALRERILQAGEQGYAIVDQELELGLRCLAVPVRNRAGRLIAALNISSLSDRVSLNQMRERHLPVLMASAEQIQRVYAA